MHAEFLRKSQGKVQFPMYGRILKWLSVRELGCVEVNEHITGVAGCCCLPPPKSRSLVVNGGGTTFRFQDDKELLDQLKAAVLLVFLVWRKSVELLSLADGYFVSHRAPTPTELLFFARSVAVRRPSSQ
jgi:hypothetical protein